MSAITAISGYNANLLSLLSQAEGTSDSSLLNSLVDGSSLPSASQDSGASSTSTGSSSDLQNQIQSAVTAALQSAEQSGNPDLKGVVYNTLVQVLQDNGIDPKTLQPTGNAAPAGANGSQQPTVDSSTSATLAQVLAALSGASAASDPVTQLTSSQDGTASSDPLTQLLSSQSGTGSSDSLSQFLALENDSQGSTDLSSLLSASGSSSQNSNDSLSSLLSSQNNNQNLLGFLYDSGQ
jgi:hypothetical protein